VVVALVGARVTIENAAVAAVEADLRHRVTLGLITSDDWPNVDGERKAWQLLTERLAKASGTRVSVIRRDGVVLGDSGVTLASLETIDNHRLRPEVQAALRSGIGIERRHSQTVKNDLLYLAMPFGNREHPTGVLRMALELKAVERDIDALQSRVGFGALLALLLAGVAAGLAATWVSKGTRELIVVAKRMSQGELDITVPEVGHSDLAELSRTLEQLARSLSSSLAELRHERDWLSAILSRMREGVVLLDSEQRIQLMNPALREMLLLTDRALNLPFIETVRNSEFKRVLDEATKENRTTCTEVELGGLNARQLLVRAAPLGDDGSAFAVVFDITETRRLESLRKEFVANVSHELRTPVAAIRMAAETIRDAARNDVAALPGFVDIILRHAERLGALVDDLLELSRIESKKVRLVQRSLDLNGVIDHTIRLFDGRMRQLEQHLDVQIPERMPAVYADEQALERVFMNLIDNAVKYAGRAATIRVVVTVSDENARVTVEDNGPGIEESYLPRIFERFYRVSSGRSRDEGGTGLGLAIVKHLLEAMGSGVDVESTVGLGTRFSFVLPLDSASRTRS
jgi:two-component system phosphate regulon sensor histidine kinase PhoR